MLLPSGRHIAVQATPLSELMESALRGGVITRLLRIEQIEDLRPWIDVMYFTTQADADPVDTAPGGLPVPMGLAPYASGFTLATIAPETADWSHADRDAFAGYLASERICTLLAALLDAVLALKRRLAAEGDFETRLQAGMWLAQCHPVQCGDVDDPLYAVFNDLDDPKTQAPRC